MNFRATSDEFAETLLSGLRFQLITRSLFPPSSSNTAFLVVFRVLWMVQNVPKAFNLLGYLVPRFVSGGHHTRHRRTAILWLNRAIFLPHLHSFKPAVFVPSLRDRESLLHTPEVEENLCQLVHLRPQLDKLSCVVLREEIGSEKLLEFLHGTEMWFGEIGCRDVFASHTGCVWLSTFEGKPVIFHRSMLLFGAISVDPKTNKSI